MGPRRRFVSARRAGPVAIVRGPCGVTDEPAGQPREMVRCGPAAVAAGDACRTLAGTSDRARRAGAGGRTADAPSLDDVRGTVGVRGAAVGQIGVHTVRTRCRFSRITSWRTDRRQLRRAAKRFDAGVVPILAVPFGLWPRAHASNRPRGRHDASLTLGGCASTAALPGRIRDSVSIRPIRPCGWGCVYSACETWSDCRARLPPRPPVAHKLIMAHRFPAIIVAAVVLAGCQDHNPAVATVGPSSAGGPGETIVAEALESGTLAAWQDGVDPARHRVITDPAPAQSGSRYLAVTYPSGRDGGWLTRFFMPGYDALNVSYHVRFPAAWAGSTKLIALYGSQVDNQWSAFGKAGLCPNCGDFFAAMMVAQAGAHPGPSRSTRITRPCGASDGVVLGRFGDGSSMRAGRPQPWRGIVSSSGDAQYPGQPTRHDSGSTASARKLNRLSFAAPTACA